MTQSALLYQQLQQLQLHQIASASTNPASASSSPAVFHQTSPSPGGGGGGHPVGSPLPGGISAGVPHHSVGVLTGGISKGMPHGSISSGIHSPLSFSVSSSFPSSPVANSGGGVSPRGSSPHSMLPQNMEPGSIPAESFTQMMQTYQSGSDTPPENFSKLLQSLQSRSRHCSGATSPDIHGCSPGRIISPGAGFQRTSDSPPQVIVGSSPTAFGSALLQNYPPSLQPSSPPPNFQNLQMIREDASDSLDNVGFREEEEEGRDMECDVAAERDDMYGSDSAGSPPSHGHFHKPLTPTSSSELDQYLLEPSSPLGLQHHQMKSSQAKKRHFAGNPQISITDTHGYVTDVITTDPSDMIDRRQESPRNSISGRANLPASLSDNSLHLGNSSQQQQQPPVCQGTHKRDAHSLSHSPSPSPVSPSLPTSAPSSHRSSPYFSSMFPTSGGMSSPSSYRHRNATSRLRRHTGYYHHHHHPHLPSHHHPQHHHAHYTDPFCDIYSSVYSPPQGSGYPQAANSSAEPIGPLGFYALSHQRQYPSGFQAMAMPLLSGRAVSPTCFPQDNHSAGGVDMDAQETEVENQLRKDDMPRVTSMDDGALSSSSHFSSLSSHITFSQPQSTSLPHSSPSSLVCSPTTSPIPIITTSAPPSPSHEVEVVPSSSPTISPSLSPSPPPPFISPASPTPAPITQANPACLSSSSRPSSPLFPSVGPSPSSSSPTHDCYSPASSPFPTPANTPRPSICTTDSGHSEMEQDSSPLSDDTSSVPPILLEIKATHRKSVGDVLQAVKAALDSICPQVDYECSDTSFRLNGHSDLLMELEVCSETDGHVPGLQVRKLSGDNLEYAKLCNHLMACVNN